jgi:hypothetical protein
MEVQQAGQIPIHRNARLAGGAEEVNDLTA